MKKVLAIVLAAILVLSLAACAKTNNEGGEAGASAATSALELMNKIWDSYAEDEKFPAGGGDFSEENMKDNAPGKYALEDKAALDADFGLTEEAAALVDDAASLKHMMNANTFTGVAFHASKADDAATVAAALKDNILARQWVCGFPDKLVIITIGDYVVSAFGENEIIETFKTKTVAAFDTAEVVCEEAITL